MMSTIRADNFGNRAGTSSITADTLLQGTTKAWCRFNGTGAIAVIDSYNVSSIADLGAGVYQVNYSVAMPNANAAAAGMSDTVASFSDRFLSISALTTVKYQTVNVENAVPTDTANMYGIIIGDPV